MNDVVADILPKAQRPLVCAKCPFCQSSAVQAVSHVADDGNTVVSYALECVTCGASGPPQALLADATRKWNQRF